MVGTMNWKDALLLGMVVGAAGAIGLCWLFGLWGIFWSVLAICFAAIISESDDWVIVHKSAIRQRGEG
jgi:uncharacterized membrane protein YoaK (UPF0700 family)